MSNRRSVPAVAPGDRVAILAPAVAGRGRAVEPGDLLGDVLILRI
jgi:hypothetical protein